MTDIMVEKIQENADRIFFPFLGKDNFFTNGIRIDKVMFTIPGIDFPVYWYGFLIGIGALLALIYAFTKFVKFGINPDKATDAVIGGLIGAVIGARLYYVAFSWSNYVINGKIQWKEIISIRDGGLAIYGGLIGALIVGGLIAKLHKIRIPALFDIAALGFLIGQAFGRWGNFFNQEAYGSVTKLPWGMSSAKIMAEINQIYPAVLPKDIAVHPCFLYESLWCIIGFFLLNAYLKRRKFDGEIFLMYSAWYGLGRAVIETFRTDSLLIPHTSVKVSQLLAILCVIVAVSVIAIVRIKIKQTGKYEFFYETEASIKQIEEYNSNNKKKKEKEDLSKSIDNAFDEEEKSKKSDKDEVNVNVLNEAEHDYADNSNDTDNSSDDTDTDDTDIDDGGEDDE